MKYTLIAIADNDKEKRAALYAGVRDFSVEQVILLIPPDLDDIKTIEADFHKFHIATKQIPLQGNTWEDVFAAMNEIAKKEKDRMLLVNVGSCDASAKCAATCAAFVNGIKAFDVMGTEIMMLPVLKFSYYSLLNEAKKSLLKILLQSPDGVSLQQLAKKAKISAPLLSYHINGTQKVNGLKQLGLVEIEEEKGKSLIKINMLGRMLMKG